MKRFESIFISSIGYFFSPYLFSVIAQAQDPCPPGFENLCKIKLEDNPDIFGNIVQALIVIAIIVSLVFLIIGGIRWIMSGGEKGKVEQAKATITAAITGLVFSLLAYAIVNFVVFQLTGNLTLNNLEFPRLID